MRRSGALKTGSKRSRNLLADIFHVWTADESGADFLLTLDARLCRAVRGQPQLRLRVKVVQPSKLITEVPPPSLRWRLARSGPLARSIQAASTTGHTVWPLKGKRKLA
ncbi:MAG: hypothetical protein U1F17_10475 [Burkholderiaceae bacterium]